MPRPTLAIDFDGVIHCWALAEGQNGEYVNGPMPGALKGLWTLHERGYDIVVFTCRPDGQEVHDMIERWYAEQGVACFPYRVTNVKPSAIAYIDDRGVRFTDWPDVLAMFGKPDTEHVLLPGR
jgi:hypothetical protein